MVRRVINMLYKEVRGLHQAAYVLAAFTFGSQLLALVRDRLLAAQFGADIELDLYYAAFRIPDILFVLFASTLSVYVLIPFVAARIKGDDAHEAQALLSQVFAVFLIAYTVLVGAVWIVLPWLQPVLFPGFGAQSGELIEVTRILLLQPLFLGISSLFGVVTQLGHRFVLYALSPLIYNMGIIIGIAFLYPVLGLQGLACGVVAGAFGHMAVQWPLVRESSLAFGIARRIDWPLMRSVLRISIPRATTLALNQFVLLALIGTASVMTVGSVAVFQFAFNLQSVPLAVVGASYSIAAFPLLADLYAQNKHTEFRFHIMTALRHIIFWSVPIIGLVIVLRAHIVRVVLGSGAFDWADTRLTAAVLAVLVLSLVAQAVYLLIVRTFYAGGYTRAPFFITLFGAVVALSGVYVLYQLYHTSPRLVYVIEDVLRLRGVLGSEIIVVALAYTGAALVQTILLLWYAQRLFGLALGALWGNLYRSLFAAIVGASATYLTLNLFEEGIRNETFAGIFVQGFIGGLAGVAGVVLGYYALRSPELSEVYRAFHARLFKTDVVAPQEDVI